MFATSTLLLPMSKLGMCSETMPLLQSVEMGVEILEAMDESVVARKSVEIIRHYLREFRASGAQQTSAPRAEGEAEASTPTDQEPGQSAFDIPVSYYPHSMKSSVSDTISQEWAYGFGFPDYSFEGIARLFDDIGGLPMLDG